MTVSVFNKQNQIDSLLMPQMPQTVVTAVVIDDADLFTSIQDGGQNNISNVVGYFANGSFYWYVPDWVADHWIASDFGAFGGVVLKPREDIFTRTFSDITIAVNPSSETYNALTMYDEDRKSSEGKLIIDEVFLNKHTDGGIAIQMETNTRIYHVQREVAGKTYDRYYIDGSGGKSLYLNFSALTSDFYKYEKKIRELVEGIGMGIQPQG
jgi:hypothetical protein